MQALYTAEATAVGGRQGHVRSSDGVIDLDLALPKELGGAGGARSNPEQQHRRDPHGRLTGPGAGPGLPGRCRLEDLVVILGQ